MTTREIKTQKDRLRKSKTSSTHSEMSKKSIQIKLIMHVLEVSAKVYNCYSYLYYRVVSGAIAAIIIAVVVLIVLFAIVGFIVQLLAPVIAGIIILIIVVVGGAWLYAKYRSR